MNQCLRSLSCFLAVAALAVFSTEASRAGQPQAAHARKTHEAQGGSSPSQRCALENTGTTKHADAKRKSKPSKDEPAPKEANASAHRRSGAGEGRHRSRAQGQDRRRDRHTEPDRRSRRRRSWSNGSSCATPRPPRISTATPRSSPPIPDWPSAALLRRRAEARLWQERSDAATVRGFIGDRPTSAKGKFALARVLLAEGDREGAARLVARRLADRTNCRSARRARPTRPSTTSSPATTTGRAWTSASAPRISRAPGAPRKHLGGDELAIVKACAAVKGKADKALSALDDVATDARGDLGYTLCRVQWMLAQNKIDDAARVMLAAAPDTMALQDTDAMVARAAPARAQAARSGQVPDRL